MGRNSAHTVLMTPVKHPALAGPPDHILALIAARCQESDQRIWAPSVNDKKRLLAKTGLSRAHFDDLIRLLEWCGCLRIYERAGKQRNRPNVYQVLDPARPLSAGDAATLTLNPHPARVHQRGTRDLWTDADEVRHSNAIADGQQQRREKRADVRMASGTTWTPRVVRDADVAEEVFS